MGRGCDLSVMQPDVHITTIAHVIQLAVAPVFLLTGIASMLGVLTNRLGRIIDRARMLEGSLPDVPDEHQVVLSTDLHMLSRRASHMNRAIGLFTTAALLVCLVIVALFVSAFFAHDVSLLVAALFVLSMISVIVGLVNFIREIQLATRSLRIGPH